MGPGSLRPGYRARPGRPSVLVAVVAVAALVVTGVLTVARHDTGTGAIAVLGLVLVAVLGSARAARVRALQDRDAARRAESVAADLRDEVLRLRSDLARLAARVEAAHRSRGRGGTDDDRPRPAAGS